MSSIPNLNTLRTSRGGLRSRRGGRGAPDDGHGRESDLEAGRDKIIQQTDHDASSSRMSAIQLGYLEDEVAKHLWPAGQEVPKRYPIINRGTFVRSQAIDRLITLFLQSTSGRRVQIVSLGAGSDTRFFRFSTKGIFSTRQVDYHELDFESNVNQKRDRLRSSTYLSDLLLQAEKVGCHYHLHSIDLRDLTAKAPPTIPNLDPGRPTLLLSECCLCYLAPDTASSVVQYFKMNLKSSVALIVYEPIRPFDAFGKTMVTNLASRGIHLQTLKRYSTLEAQRQRMKLAGFDGGQGARDVYELWQDDAWVLAAERQRVESLEWLDEIEEWQLLASHYCVAWGWTGDAFDNAWRGIEGGVTAAENRHDQID